jgi:hypothetical protein
VLLVRCRAIALDRDGNAQRFDWPQNGLGDAVVPRVSERVVLPEATYVVHDVLWHPLGDHAEQIAEPFVVVVLRVSP